MTCIKEVNQMGLISDSIDNMNKKKKNAELNPEQVSPEEINEYDEDLARYVQAVRARKKQRIAEVE
jgi:hypothetical protein